LGRLTVSFAASPLLFALEHPSFSSQEAAREIQNLGDATFWTSDAQVEIMRILVARWAAFDSAEREAIEARLRQGAPRKLFREDAFEDEDEWVSVLDSSIYRRLKRIESAGGSLSQDSKKLLGEIAGRHPTWKPGASDRDDFHSWHESRSGPDSHPELLTGIADDRLVKEAMRLQREQRFEEGNIWRVFCSADPERALRGLKLEADKSQWEIEAWRCLLWAAGEKRDQDFQFDLADVLLLMPRAPLKELLPSATFWLQRQRQCLSVSNQAGGPRFGFLWDRFAALAYVGTEAAEEDDGNDLVKESLNRPGGVLAWTLLDALSALKPEAGSGLGAEFRRRFDKVAGAGGRAGLLARIYLIRALAYFDAIDPKWTEEKLRHRLSWDHPEALALWRSYAHGSIGSARLFNSLKPAILAAFELKQLSDNEFEGLVSNLLSICISHQRGEAVEYSLTSAEMKRALTVGPSSARRKVAWNLWRMMGDAEGEPIEKASRWRETVGPLLRNMWPLDANLRGKGTTQNFVLMALECEQAFPEAVEAILDFLVPYELYQIAHSLRLESTHDHLVSEYPLAFVRLANALIDPGAFPVPNDLAALLQECIAANPTVAHDPAYTRLYGLRRQRNA
jgi:hypothetical protein